MCTPKVSTGYESVAISPAPVNSNKGGYIELSAGSDNTSFHLYNGSSAVSVNIKTDDMIALRDALNRRFPYGSKKFDIQAGYGNYYDVVRTETKFEVKKDTIATLASNTSQAERDAVLKALRA